MSKIYFKLNKKRLRTKFFQIEQKMLANENGSMRGLVRPLLVWPFFCPVWPLLAVYGAFMVFYGKIAIFLWIKIQIHLFLLVQFWAFFNLIPRQQEQQRFFWSLWTPLFLFGQLQCPPYILARQKRSFLIKSVTKAHLS